MHRQTDAERLARAREQMLRDDLIGRNITDPQILRLFKQIPREEFVPQAYRSQAYDDGPLPIGAGQTISQPYIVALMTQLLKLNRNCEVLEIGTGSGYQTAILAGLAKKVYTIEKLSQLSEAAQTLLSKLDINNVEFFIGDGSCGWPMQRTFERIIITAAVPKWPQPLLEQLADGGIMVGPVGYSGVQVLMVCAKKAGRITEKVVCDVRFVRLLGEYSFEQ